MTNKYKSNKKILNVLYQNQYIYLRLIIDELDKDD